MKRAEDTEGVLCQTHIGGQALIEGVMMRGKYSWAVAVRTPDGDIYTEEHDLKATQDRNGWLYWPIIRGCRALVESLALGYKALGVASDHAFDFEEEEREKEEKRRRKEEKKRLKAAKDDAAIEADSAGASPAIGEVLAAAEPEAGSGEREAEGKEPGKDEDDGKFIMIVGSVLGIVLGLALFILLPAWLSNLVVGNYEDHVVMWNVVDGLLRVAVFVFYVWIISFMKDIKRMYRYHGAEHQTIHCFEHGLELTPENARQFPTLHVRCGTAFLIMTLVLAIIVFSMVPVKAICVSLGLTAGFGQFAVIVLARIVFLPLIAGLGYELTVKWAGAHPDRKSVQIVLWPGLQMQKLTTAVPDDSMLECAIVAMKMVLAREELEERKAAGGEAAAEPVPASCCGDASPAAPVE